MRFRTLVVVGALFAALPTTAAPQDSVRVAERSGWLGIRLDAGLTGTRGADSAYFEIVITDVYRSGPADQGGVIAGDRLVAVNGSRLPTWDAWVSAVGGLGPGQTLYLTVQRGTAERDVAIVAGTRPATLRPSASMERFFDAQARMSRHVDSLFRMVIDWGDITEGMLSAEQRLWEATREMVREAQARTEANRTEERLRDPMEPPDAGGGGGPRVRRVEMAETARPHLLAPFVLRSPVVLGGAFVRDLTTELGRVFGVESGVLVTDVMGLSPAALAGLRAGDVITAVSGETSGTVAELRALLVQAVFPVDLTVTRQGSSVTIAYPR